MNNESNQKPPFFIVGCVRSGTTLLRDILRQHQHLACPEETHFFRWGDPFGTPRFDNIYKNSKVLKNQQAMDGISEYEFTELLRRSASKKALAEDYAHLYMNKLGESNCRWFDKSPQNIYGILLLSACFPDSIFLHIYRNPLNVVASLLEGKVMPVHPFKGAINYWMESMLIINQFKKAWPERLFEIGYEDFTTDPKIWLNKILSAIGEAENSIQIPPDYVHPEKNKYRTILEDKQIEMVKRMCEPYFSQYNYQ